MANTSKATHMSAKTQAALKLSLSLGKMSVPEHVVQFYQTDDFLLDTLTEFIGTGLEAGDVCIVIATTAHHESLEHRLQANGVDPAAAHARDQYIALDADTVLSQVMVDGLPEPECFAEVVGSMVAQATQRRRHVRIFGEMVALLWNKGNQAAAIRLEELWNGLHHLHDETHPFSLFCAYSMHGFVGEGYAVPFATICSQHSQVIPDESYPAPSSRDEHLRAISLLQQKANSLQAEVVERKRAEKRLRVSENRYRRLFEASRDGILLVDPRSGTIAEANPAALELLGYARNQVLGQVLWQVGLFPDREPALAVMRESQAAPGVCNKALSLQTPDGRVRHVEFVSHPYRANRHNMIQCTLRDVTALRLAEQEAKEHARELEAIQSVTDVALAHLSSDDLLRVLLERLRAVLAVDNAALLLVNDDGRDLTIYLACGPEEEVAGQVRVPIGRGVAGRIAASRRPLIIDDLSTAEVANPFLRERLRSLVGVPLLVEDRLLGVLHVATATPHHFTETDVRLLQLVADRIALAIDHARLYQNARDARRETDVRAKQLEATIEAMADGLAIFDSNGGLLKMNSAAGELLALPHDADYYTRPPHERGWESEITDEQGHPLPQDEWPYARMLRGEVLTGANAVAIRYRMPGREPVQLEISGAPVRDDTGRITSAVCVLRDVTERKRLERQAHDTLQALLEIVRTVVAAPAVGDVPDRFPLGRDLAELVRRILPLRYASLFTVTPGTEQLEMLAVAGYTPEQEALLRERNTGLPLRARLTDLTQRRRLLAGEVVVLDVTQPRYEEQRRLYGSTQGVLVPLRVGDRFIGTLGMNPLEGVTLTERELALAEGVAQMAALVIERERLLREREEARASELALHESNRQMNAFVGIASHELRTPVTSMKANVQLSVRAVRALQMLSVPDTAAPKLQRAIELLESADQQANKLNRLIEDLLDVTRVETGTLELRREWGDLGATARDVVEQVRLAWPGRAISLDLPDAPANLEIDADRIAQVIANFLTNALKYSAPDAPVAVSVAYEGSRARVAVTDRGPGLAAAQLARLWELFHRVPGIQQQSGSGAGLGIGLYICKTIIEEHGGQVGVDSQVGAGSTFWFTLPTPTATVEEESK